MPTSPPRLCPGCKQRVTGRCATCQPAWVKTSRPGSTRRWRKQRRVVLAEQPICAGWPTRGHCQALATEVDHIDGRSDGRSNLQGLCTNCHEAKTQAEAAAARQR